MSDDATASPPPPPLDAAGEPPEIHGLYGDALERFLQRQKATSALPAEPDLALQLRLILERARALVPSVSGAILLDDPLRKGADRARNELCCVAAFGTHAHALPGSCVPAAEGVAGRAYRTGKPHLSGDAPPVAGTGAAEAAAFSVIAAPVAIGGAVFGVIELADRLDGAPFDARDLALLDVFAGYTSSALQNALDGKRLHELARRDDLTGLFNDRWLHLRLMEMIAEADEAGRSLALLFFDLDRFKAVNDTHGHLAGSEVLRQVGFLLRRTVDAPGVVAARYGGDEFVVALPDTEMPAALAAAERIRAAIQDATFLDRRFGPDLPPLHLSGAVTASFGVAVYHPTSTGAPHLKEADLLRRADTAMYAAKAAGKNRVLPTE